MRTSKPISTISYNTPDFLRNKIEEWKLQGIIEYGMWIRHEPEEDEKKAHFHLYLKPAKLVQTMDLETASMELDPENPDKPLKMISFRVSKESDWVLYCLHDPNYLIEKGMSRAYCYGVEDIESTCEDTLKDILSRLSDDRKGRLEYRLVECINIGMSWQEIVRSGLVPLRQMSSARLMYGAITGQDMMDKGGHI